MVEVYFRSFDHPCLDDSFVKCLAWFCIHIHRFVLSVLIKSTWSSHLCGISFSFFNSLYWVTFCTGFGAAMVIESLGLYYHVQCFRCYVCHTPLGSGNQGADVRVRVNKLHCPNCYSNDEGIRRVGRF